MIYGIDAEPLQEHWTPVDAIAVIKCLDEEGHPQLILRPTDGLSSWEGLGMLVTATDSVREDLKRGWQDEEGSDG